MLNYLIIIIIIFFNKRWQNAAVNTLEIQNTFKADKNTVWMYIMSVDNVRPWLSVGIEVKHALNKITVHEMVSFARELQTMFPMSQIIVLGSNWHRGRKLCKTCFLLLITCLNSSLSAVLYISVNDGRFGGTKRQRWLRRKNASSFLSVGGACEPPPGAGGVQLYVNLAMTTSDKQPVMQRHPCHETAGFSKRIGFAHVSWLWLRPVTRGGRSGRTTPRLSAKGPLSQVKESIRACNKIKISFCLTRFLLPNEVADSVRFKIWTESET